MEDGGIVEKILCRFKRVHKIESNEFDCVFRKKFGGEIQRQYKLYSETIPPDAEDVIFKEISKEIVVDGKDITMPSLDGKILAISTGGNIFLGNKN
jgi:hypothetical protein